MNAFTAVAIINTALIVSVAAISLTGILMFGSFHGLWSMLMLLFMASTSTGKGAKE